MKIGYQAGIKLLRAGAHLIVTTRFPRDAATRYAQEADFDEWGDRLEIFGLDLRHTPSVEGFCEHLRTTRDRLDFIVNNACQTVRRPPDFYQHMLDARARVGAHDARRACRASARRVRGPAPHGHPAGGRRCDARPARRRHALGGAVAGRAARRTISTGRRDLFPEGRLDQDLQQVDLRDRNSWRLLLAEVSSVELLETQLVNAVAPFVLNARLKPLMLRTPDRDKHIVNVSAVEGQFYRKFKTTSIRTRTWRRPR